MKKILLFLIIVIFLLLFSRVFEILKPIDNIKNIEWREVFTLSTLDKKYVAQGIEVYKDYLLYTVHKDDESSLLLVFKIKDGNLIYLFSSNFPEIATHVSDLSIYDNKLYAIDYASNNLYRINLDKTIQSKKLIIDKTVQTNLKRSGSIIITKYHGKTVALITQFILSNKILVYYLDDISNKDKKTIAKIDAKYYIQGLYEKDGLIYVSSNKLGIDPIFVIKKQDMFEKNSINLPSTVILASHGKMIEDIVVYKGYLITSDEEDNKIYISKKTINDILKGK